MWRLARSPLLAMRRWFCRGRRGAGTVVTAVLVTVLAGAVLATWHAAENVRIGAAHDREAGRLWAGWFLALHRSAQQGLVPATVWSPGDAVEVTAAQIVSWGAAPSGLLEEGITDAGMRFGLLDDGAGVAMAFAVLTPGSGWPDNMRGGALEAGLGDVAESGTVGGSASAIASNEGAIATVLGAALDDGSLFVTADWAIRRPDSVLHRRAQPGRPELSRMQAALSFDSGFGIVGAGAMDGGSASVSAVAEVGADVVVDGDTSFGGTLNATGGLDADLGITAPALTAGGSLTAAEARVSGALGAGSLNAGSRVSAATAVITGSMTVTSCSGCGW